MERTTRRSLLKTGSITGLTLSIAGCLNNDNTTDTPTNDTNPNSSDETGNQKTPDFEQQLDEVRTAISDYEDPTAAIEDGYKFGGPYVPGMGWHCTNPDYLQQAGESGPDRSQPPILTYLETDNGLALGAAEFAVPAAAVDGTPDLFYDDEVDATEEWHPHEGATHVFALPNGQQDDPANLTLSDLRTKNAWTEFSPSDTSIKAGDTVTLDWEKLQSSPPEESDGEERIVDIVSHHPTIKTLHVWVGKENPDGVFAATNPDFTHGDGHNHDH